MRRCAVVVALSACVPPSPVTVPTAALDGTDGMHHALRAPGATATVLVFFSNHCPCMQAHDARVVALAQTYYAQGVRVLAIDSEIDATLARDVREANARGYPFPILLDPHGRIAAALGAQYATYTVVLDANGDVRYRGAFDSQRIKARPGETRYVSEALDDVLAERPVRRESADALGCSLRTW
jgi:Redoxin